MPRAKKTTTPTNTNKTPIILIHGTWATSQTWGDFIPALENLGLEVHAPDLRYHDLPLEEGAAKIAPLSLTDYVDDLSQLLLSLPEKSIILGHSLGGLLAQLLAARHPDRCKGLILLGTAPMAGIFALYPTMLATFYQHYLQWGFWKKPLYPTPKRLFNYCMNQQSSEDQKNFFKKLVTESGRVYAELVFWFLDPWHASRVDTQKIQAPVLLITGSKDKVVRPQISYATAKKYPQATLVELKGSDHMYTMGHFLPLTVHHIQTWLTDNQLG